MNKQSFYTRQMLMQYGRQLVSSRRLARFEQMQGKHPLSEDDLVLRRKVMVEKIAREIVDNLIFSGSENPIVQDVRQRLEKKLGEKYTFYYPPADLAFKIYITLADGSLKEVDEAKKSSIMDILWAITLQTVDESTL